MRKTDLKTKLSAKSKTKKLFLSIVTLVLILSIAVTTVYGWVETISSVVIESKGHTLQIVDPLLTNANINTANSNTIDLLKYFRAAGNVHVSQASSANGKDIYFPVVSNAGSSTKTYRKANINDKNVNYYDFSFKVKPTKAYDFYFEKVPIFKIGVNDYSENFLCAISLDSNAPKIYSKTAYTNQPVVGNVNGTNVNITTKSFASAVKPASGTPNKDNAVFSIADTSEHTVNVKIWLQGKIGSHEVNAQDRNGELVSIDRLLLVPNVVMHKVTLTPVTNGTVQKTNATGGKVGQSGQTLQNKEVVLEVEDGTSVTMSASANTGYDFKGWSTTSTAASGSASLSVKVTTNLQYYAIFKTKTFTINAHSVVSGSSTDSTTGGYVKISSPSSIATTNASTTGNKTVNYNTSVTFVATAQSNYTFEGWYTAATGGTLKSSSASYTASITDTSHANIYARFKPNVHTTTFYIEPRSGFTQYTAWIWTTYHNYTGGTWPGSNCTFDTTTGYYKYSFESNEDTSTDVSIIISNNGGSQTGTLTGKIGGTYVLKNNNTLEAYDPAAQNTMCIVLKDGTSNSWLNNSTPTFKLVNTSTSVKYTMTRIDDNTWFVTKVPKTATHVRFERGTWNYWPSSTGSMTRSSTYYKYTATGDGSGSWAQKW